MSRLAVPILCLLLLAAGVALASPGNDAHAAPRGEAVTQARDVSAEVAALIEQLGHADYKVRRRATVKLLQDNSLTVQDFPLLYASASGAEQRQRLLTVARHHLVRHLMERQPPGQRGALGLMIVGAPAMELPQLGRPAVRVIATFPGFPAYAWLEPGDLIVDFMGQPMPDLEVPDQIRVAFIDRASQLPPGQLVTVGVWRRGELTRPRFPLASFDQLDSMYNTADQNLRSPYQLQWQQMLQELRQQEPSAPPLTVDLGETTAAR